MKFRLNKFMQVAAAGVLFGCTSFASHAEITLLKQDPKANDPLSRLNFEVGGSIRPGFQNGMGNKDRGGYKNNGYDDGTRFRFTAKYYLFDDVQWVTMYDLGVDMYHVLDWKDKAHYATPSSLTSTSGHPTSTRQLYTGFSSQQYGTFTYGKMYGVYYNVVGAKTDIWDYDMLAQASGNGINGDFDGSYRSRNQFMYKKTGIGPVDIYASYALPDRDLIVGNDATGKGDLLYKRHEGGALGADYHITPTLTWGTSYEMVRAELKDAGTNTSKYYDQQLLGTGLSWKPDNWTLATTLGWYKNFLTMNKYITKPVPNVNNYFEGNAYGVEYYAGYKFPISQYAIKYIQPYFMGDHLKYVDSAYVSGTNEQYQRTDNGLGVTFQFDYGVRVDFEHMVTNDTIGTSSLNRVRFYYDF
jgi:predicted porin